MPRRSTDRELLLGVLALKNDFIDRHALVAAFDLWAHKREQALADILRELGHLREQDLAVLDALVENHLARHGGDPLQSLAAVVPSAAAREELASLAEVEPAAVQDRARSALAALIEPLATTVSVGQNTSEGTRFCILRPHAKGGLGEVYVADDQELHREVALKQMRERHADDAPSRARFLVEAEITGGLQHPGIVPVYGLGAYPNGRPFYAMRFIRGEMLHDAILRFHSAACDGNRAPGKAKHDADARGIAGNPTPHVSQPSHVTAGDGPPLDDGLPLERDPASNHRPNERTTARSYASREFRDLLSRFIAVCQAIEYAHSRGVIHRDLKPQNIMLGRFGETLVVDWGLAKPLGHTQGATKAPTVPNERAAGFGEGGVGAHASPSDEPPLLPQSGPDSEPTQMGRVLGTPAYMSPEQAAGRHDLLTPASDVYALGATLYCLLTGQPPFASDADGRLLERVEKGGFAPPRAIRHAVPRPLEAICLKAMALSAMDRYPSALALADDLQRWLADEPVAAHHERFGERTGRWLRGHRAATRAAAIAVLLIAVVSLGALALVDAARRNTADALAAETNAKNAETTAKQAETAAKNEAKSAIDRFVETVNEAELLKDDRFQPLRKKLLSEALSYYQAFIEAHEHDAKARAELARALSNVGKISELSGSKTDAIAAYQRALAIGEKLVAENPTIAQYRNDLGNDFHNLGHLQHVTGGSEAAVVSYRRAMAIRAKLATENPNVTQYQSALAKSCHNLGNIESETGDREAALASYQRAFAIRENLALENPLDAQYQSELAKSYNDLGFLWFRSGQLEAAQPSLEKAVAIHQKLAAENPAVPNYQDELAKHLMNLGGVQSDMGDREAARKTAQRALAIQEKLAAENPTIFRYQHTLGQLWHNLGVEQGLTGDRDAARASVTRAQAIFGKLSAENPSVTMYQSDLALSNLNLGEFQQATGDREAALLSFQRALEILGKLVSENPTVTEYQDRLAASCRDLGDLQRQMGDRTAAIASWQRALAIWEELSAEDETVTKYRYDLAGSCNDLGILQKDAGDRDAALASYHRALAIWEKLSAEKPTVTEYQSGLATSYKNLGNLQSASDHDAAIACYHRALAIWEKLSADNPTAVNYKDDLANNYNTLCILQSDKGDRDAARASCQRELAIRAKLAEENPNVSQRQSELAISCHNLGILESKAGNREAARASYQRELAIREKLAADNADNVDYQIQVGGSYCDLGNLVCDGDAEGALVSYTRAVEALQGVVDRNPRHPTARLFLRNTYWGRANALDTLGRDADAADAWQHAAELDDSGQLRFTFRLSHAAALARAGDHTRASAEAAELAAIEKLPGVALYNLGCCFSVASASSKDDMALADHYALLAVELLARAKGAGFFADRANVEHLRKDNDLDVLRERDDFRKFVEELAKPSPKGQE